MTFNIDVKTIKCFDTSGEPPSEQVCAYALDIVPATAEMQTIGPRGWKVDVELPQVFRERKFPQAECVIAANMVTSTQTTTSWLLPWSAANTVNAMCIRQGKVGQYVGFGEIDLCKHQQ